MRRRAGINFRHILSYLVFLVWSLVFASFYFSGSYVEFLNPQFSWLVISGFVLCLVFFLVFFFGGSDSGSCQHHDHHHHEVSLLRLLILLVPVLFAINYRSWQLGSFAFDKRSVGTARVGGLEPGNKLENSSADIEKGIVDASLFEIHQSFEKLAGRKIRTCGMYMAETPGLPDDSWVIFRFMIVCCAADAQPLAVMVHGNRPVMMKDEAWLEIEGVLGSVELNGNPAVVIEAEKISAIAAPKVPYLVPGMR